MMARNCDFPLRGRGNSFYENPQKFLCSFRSIDLRYIRLEPRKRLGADRLLGKLFGRLGSRRSSSMDIDWFRHLSRCY